MSDPTPRIGAPGIETPTTGDADGASTPTNRERIPPIDRGEEAMFICLLLPLGVVGVVGLAYLVFELVR